MAKKKGIKDFRKKRSETDFYLSNLSRFKKSVLVRKQSISLNKAGLLLSRKGLSLIELIVKLNHPSSNVKNKALNEILALISSNKLNNYSNYASICQAVWPLRWHLDDKIRLSADKLIKYISKDFGNTIWFQRMTIAYLTEGYSNPSLTIVKDSIELTKNLIKSSEDILNRLSQDIIRLIIKNNSKEIAPLQCDLLYTITRTHPCKYSSFLSTESLEILLLEERGISQNCEKRILEIAIHAFIHKFDCTISSILIEKIKIMLEAGTLIKECLKQDIKLRKNLELSFLSEPIPSLKILNKKEELKADEMIFQLLTIKWEIEIIVHGKSDLESNEVEKESMCRVIDSKFFNTIPKSVNSLIDLFLDYPVFKDFKENIYPYLHASHHSANETIGSLLDEILYALESNLPASIIRQVLNSVLDEKNVNKSPKEALEEIKNSFNIYIKNLFS